MQLFFLFRLDLILHARATHIQCDRFVILNFASKPGYSHVPYILRPVLAVWDT